MIKHLMLWVMVGMLTFSGLTLTSCSKVDNTTQPTKTTDDRLFQMIGGIRLDKSMEDYGVVRLFDFNEDKTFECYTYYRDDVNSDGYMGEAEFIQEYSAGTWSDAGQVACDIDGGSYDGVNLDYQVKGYYDADGNEIGEPEETSYNDLIYLMPAEGGYAFINRSELFALFADYDESGSAQHRSFFDILDGIKKAAEAVGSAVVAAGEAIGEGVVAVGKTVGKGVVATVNWTRKAVADSYDPDIYGQSDWMTRVFKDVNPKLHEISLPGSHDTFTYGTGKILGNWAKTQVLNIQKQFDAGVRFFDLRINWTWGFPHYFFDLSHGPISCNVKLIEALDQLKELIKAHPGETVICSLKFENTDETQELMGKLKDVLAKYNDIMMDPSLYKEDMRLNDCKGKIVLMQRFPATGKAYKNGDIGIYANGDDNVVTKCGYGSRQWDYMEQDMYECLVKNLSTKKLLRDDTHYTRRVSYLEQNMADAANPPASRPNTWHQNKTSGYVKMLGGAILGSSLNAQIMNAAAIKYIKEHMGHKTGWIVTDYAGVNKYGAVCPTKVQGAELIKVLIDNNVQMLNDGVFK